MCRGCDTNIYCNLEKVEARLNNDPWNPWYAEQKPHTKTMYPIKWRQCLGKLQNQCGLKTNHESKQHRIALLSAHLPRLCGWRSNYDGMPTNSVWSNREFLNTVQTAWTQWKEDKILLERPPSKFNAVPILLTLDLQARCIECFPWDHTVTLNTHIRSSCVLKLKHYFPFSYIDFR